MNKTKRTAAVILSVLAMCAAMLAGCSESSSKSTSSSKPDSSEQNTSSQSESVTTSETTASTSASQETTTTATTSQPEETTSETSASSQQTQQAAATTTAAQGTPVSKADLKAASQAAAKQSNETAKQAGWSVVDEGEVINKDTEYGYWVYYHIDKNHNGQPSDFVGIWKSTINKKGELETQLYIPMMGEDKNKLESFTVNYNKDSGLELIKKMGK
jgi:DNA mismatch repair ATPase MutL